VDSPILERLIKIALIKHFLMQIYSLFGYPSIPQVWYLLETQTQKTP